MFVVLISGTVVTDTGSQTGCGRFWPLCHGELIPQFAMTTLIEFTHRTLTGIESFLILATAASVFWLATRNKVLTGATIAMVAGLFAEAGMGAWAVLEPQAAYVLALHFGISLAAFSATTSVAFLVRRPVATKPSTPRWVGRAAFAYLAYLVAVVYSGALIRHTGAAAACTTWPLCGASPPSLHLALDLLHRSLASFALPGALALTFLVWRYKAPLLVNGWLTASLVCAQGAAGVLLVVTHFSVGSELVHGAVAGLLFSSAVILWIRLALSATTVDRMISTDAGSPQEAITPMNVPDTDPQRDMVNVP